METAENTSLITKEVEDFKVVIQAAPEALEKNLLLAQRAVEKGNELRARIDEGQMDDSLDQELNDHIVKLRKGKEMANGRRTPFTKMMDSVKSKFTGVEKVFDQEEEAFQKVRDAYAKLKREEEAERKRIADLKIAKEKETIEMRSKLEMDQEEWFNKLLSSEIERLHSNFNRITLENFDKAKEVFKNLKPEFSLQTYSTWNSFIGSNILSADEVNAIVAQVKSAERYDAFLTRYVAEVTDAITMINDRMSGKYAELIKIKEDAERAAEAKRLADELAAKAKSEAEKAAAEKAKADAEAARVRAEEERVLREAREKQEAEDRAKAAAAAEAKAKAEAEVKKDAELTNTLFDHEMQSAVTAPTLAEGRESYEITVNAPPGFMLIFQQWFANEGKNLTVDQILKKKVDSMVTFCEKLAHKNPKEKIDSAFITYTEKFKTKVVKS